MTLDTSWRATCHACDWQRGGYPSEVKARAAARAHALQESHPEWTVVPVRAVADGGVRRFDVPDGMTLHHVVCRDCPMEQLCDYPDTAKAVEVTHAERTGHTVAREAVKR